MPVDTLLPQLAARPSPNLGALLEELLNLINSQLLGLVPCDIVNAPLNVGGFQEYLNPVLPSGGISLVQFAQLLAEFLAPDLSHALLHDLGAC